MPDTLLTDNGPQFTAKFFESVSGMLGIRYVLTTAYPPQTYGQAERFNRTLVARLRQYVSEHQRDWDDYVQPLTYAYNMQVHRSTGTTPFDLTLTRHPPGISVQASSKSSVLKWHRPDNGANEAVDSAASATDNLLSGHKAYLRPGPIQEKLRPSGANAALL